MTRGEAEVAAASWRRRSERLKAQRDHLIRALEAAGINKHQIHLRMGVSRDTVYRVLRDAGPLDGETS